MSWIEPISQSFQLKSQHNPSCNLFSKFPLLQSLCVPSLKSSHQVEMCLALKCFDSLDACLENILPMKAWKMQYVFIKQALKTLKRKSGLMFYSCDCRKMGQALSGENVSSNLPWWTRQSQRETDRELWCCISIHLFVNEDGTDRFQSDTYLPWKWKLRGGMVLRWIWDVVWKLNIEVGYSLS